MNPFMLSLLSSPFHRDTVSCLISKAFDLTDTVVNPCIVSSLSVCVTADIWSNRQMRSYLDVKANNIGGGGVNFESIVFTCPSLSEKKVCNH